MSQKGRVASICKISRSFSYPADVLSPSKEPVLNSVIHFSHSPFNNISSHTLSVPCPSSGTPLPHPSIQFSSSSTSSCTYIFILAQQQVLECLFECGVAQCITSRVDSRVNVTQPVANSPYGVWDAGLAEGWDQYHDIVWRPCNDESQQNSKDGLGHL